MRLKLSFFENGLLVVGVCIIGFLAFGPQIAINYTGSIPKGIYLVLDKEPDVGNYTFLIDQHILSVAYHRGYAAEGTRLGKKIVAGRGDSVIINSNGIFINGHKLPNSQPFSVDSQGRAMPIVSDTLILTNEEYVLYGKNPRSFDSRYYGVVSRDDITQTLFFILGL